MGLMSSGRKPKYLTASRFIMMDFQAIYGIDFSGAKDTGNKIWITKGVPEGGKILVTKCLKARDLPTSGRMLEACLASLVNLINSNRNAAFGLDFPFGLPASLVKKKSWDEFILNFPNRFNDPDDFKVTCFSEARNRELKRKTDNDARTPFSAYNLRLYKQTYYGISEILFPLVRYKSACILPFHRPKSGKLWILEICPASTLRSLELNGIPYKGREKTHKENRGKILKQMEWKCPVIVRKTEIRKKILENHGGDALDSVIAAIATFNALKNKDSLIPDDDGLWKIEGHIYV